ncbi:PepSY-associated TM helix domain-containing protein [Couchioplanes caeruleus]|uniref:Peptidase n=2 Tax=Couchioplanes caeruleus TaxID=56438 RepID=A0A1K0FA83_9ACTN|nr:PepSY domain-containing protein [Couchioplanes caeruleus]OJF09753.1 peptidase [Couchioplanes caeruleus subsp. caeruleus]ROP28897.1 putative iron-regulated membrane protein [Couchioplanes caeruleus]
MTTTAPPSAAPPAEQRRVRPAGGFGPLLLRLHFYAGVLVAPFLLVAALTGLAYVFAPQAERIVYADELVVADPGAQPRPLGEQIAAARAAHPEGALITVRPGDGDATTQIDFTSPELDEEHQHTVYVNPYTGKVTGQLTTWWATTPLKTWLDDLHRNLHLGDLGRHYSEFAASWLGVIALGGLMLWWRRQRGNRTARKLLTPDLSAKKGVRRTRGWHAATGVWLTVGLLVLSATGLTWSRYAGDNFSVAVDALKGSRPSVSTSLTGGAAETPGGHHGGGTGTGTPVVDPAAADAVMKVARDNGLSGPLEITVPEGAATAWSVGQIRNEWPVGRDVIAVDAATGKVVDRVDFADWPLLAKLTRWGINAHMGTLFGLVNQLLLAALAVGLICVIVWGYRMWWQRRPTRAGRRALAGAPPARGAWQQLPAWGIVAGVPLVLALGWALPLFGIPLAAFLLFDIAAGAIRGRRRPPPVPVSPAPAGR